MIKKKVVQRDHSKHIKARICEDNERRMRSNGTPIQLDLGFEYEIDTLAVTSRKLADKFIKSSNPNFLQWEVQSDPALFLNVAFIVGVARESLKSFTKDLEDGKLGKQTKKIRELMKYEDWESDGFPNGVLVDPEDAKLFGYCNLLLQGHKYYKTLKNLYPWLRWCSKQSFTDITVEPLSTTKKRAYSFLKGSHSARKGNTLERISKDVLAEYGVRVLTKKNRRSGSTWDLVIEDLLYVQMSFNQATAGNISYKRLGLCQDIGSVRNSGKYFFFVGGGPGWTLRDEDLKSICSRFDYCFGNTVEQYVEFLHCILNDHLKIKVTKQSLSRRVRKHLLG